MLERMTTTSHPVLDELAATEALGLMAGVPIGRVVFTQGALPAIRPVHFVLDSGSIVFRVVADDRLTAALHQSVVAFQADEYDADHASGWSVTATGHSVHVDDPAEVARLAALLPASCDADCKIFRVQPELVTGRRLWR
jgi:hypothetical protein